MPAMLSYNDNTIDTPHIVCPFMAVENYNNKIASVLDIVFQVQMGSWFGSITHQSSGVEENK